MINYSIIGLLQWTETNVINGLGSVFLKRFAIDCCSFPWYGAVRVEIYLKR